VIGRNVIATYMSEAALAGAFVVADDVFLLGHVADATGLQLVTRKCFTSTP